MAHLQRDNARLQGRAEVAAVRHKALSEHYAQYPQCYVNGPPTVKLPPPAVRINPDRWDGKAKLAAVIQTAAMNESERSAYCREYGLYVEQLDAWTQSFKIMDPLEGSVRKADLTAARKLNRKLEKELHRKEKARAEAAALLTLSIKARAIWGSVRWSN